MKDDNFYAKIKSNDKLQDLFNEYKYHVVPDTWSVVATDIKGSTKAISEGRYKEVNMVGAITIIAILNIEKKLDLPFIFGGDGAFVLVPNYLLDKVKRTLFEVKKLSINSYNLNLRIGIVPVGKIYEDNFSLKIAKLKVSEKYSQAIIKGGGLEYCDELLKNSNKYLVEENNCEAIELDLEGLECRWEKVNSPKDEVLSLLIKANDERTYYNVLENIETLLGDNASRSPININNLKLSFKTKELNTEASLYSNNIFYKAFVILKIKSINFIGKILMDYNIGQWGKYKKRITSYSDTEKFDDMLRLTVCSTFEETLALEKYLKQQFNEGNIIYGIHKTDSSFMTCLIFERHGKHIHFVDGTNGGYAMAAKMMKEL